MLLVIIKVTEFHTRTIFIHHLPVIYQCPSIKLESFCKQCPDTLAGPKYWLQSLLEDWKKKQTNSTTCLALLNADHNRGISTTHSGGNFSILFQTLAELYLEKTTWEFYNIYIHTYTYINTLSLYIKTFI